MPPPLAFFGLGAMGLGMATRLVRRGYAVTGFDVSPAARARFAAAGGRVAASPDAAARGAALCVCMVATAQQTQAVLAGGRGIPRARAAAPALAPGALVLLCATTPASFVQRLARRVAQPVGGQTDDPEGPDDPDGPEGPDDPDEGPLPPLGRPDLRLVDCPVSGGAARAADGTLTIMASAEAGPLHDPLARAVLADLAAPGRLYVFPRGGLGAASHAKMVHQVLAAAHILAAAEALGLAARLGADLATARRALLQTPARSCALEQRGARMLAGFRPVACAVAILAKDAALVTAAARARAAPVPLTAVAENVLCDALARGYAADDDSSLLRLYAGGVGQAGQAEEGKQGKQGTRPGLRSDAALPPLVALLKGIHLVAAAETLALARRVGLDLDRVLDLCIHAAGGSAMLERHGPALVAVLQGHQPPPVDSADSADSLQSIHRGLAAAADAAQRVHAPLHLGSQALSLVRLALPPDGRPVAPSAVVKLWMQ